MILEKICSRNGRNRWKKSVGKYNKKTKYVGKKKTRYVESKREQINLKVQSNESKMEGSEVVNKENKRK